MRGWAADAAIAGAGLVLGAVQLGLGWYPGWLAWPIALPALLVSAALVFSRHARPGASVLLGAAALVENAFLGRLLAVALLFAVLLYEVGRFARPRVAWRVGLVASFAVLGCAVAALVMTSLDWAVAVTGIAAGVLLVPLWLGGWGRARSGATYDAQP
ncbi:hypothetical protein [Streptacidiphilus monticola]|uniref:Sensor histidine kinase n=1 Tax=Streptacidiphilus monticola TaxID=2161674 RepID=A0ABW1G9G9_9ACTN